ncbi:MAG: asparagine synthase-related protein [Nitrospirota bacterium]
MPTQGDVIVRRERGRYLYLKGNHFEDKQYIVLLNGDLYASEFNGATDIETLIRGYKKCGDDFPHKIEGDFSFILYDKANDEVIAGRDKFGVKSLFYYKDEMMLALSSTTASLFECLPIKKEPNLSKNILYVGSHYRHFDAIREDTFFENIKAIRQAHIIKCKNGNLAEHPYWTIELLNLEGKTQHELGEEYLSLLTESIEKRLSKSNNPAFMVSSGMDSSSIAALSSRLRGERVPIFTTVFQETTEYNEADEVVPVVTKFGKEWHRVSVEPERLIQDLNEILKLANEPFYTVTQMMHYYLTREVKARGFDTLFGGIGGDEANCGEIEEYLFFFADLKYGNNEERLRKEINGWIKNHSHPLYPKSYEIAHDYFVKHINFNQPGVNYLDKERFGKYLGVFRRDFLEAHLCAPILDHPFPSYLLNKLYQDLYYEIIPCVLKAEEFNLKRFKVQGRMPYLDGMVMQYGFSIPVEMKYSAGANKAVLRAAMKGILPDETIENLQKKGWNAPFNEWLKIHLKESIMKLLENPSKRQQAIYNIEDIRALFSEHLRGTANHMMFFWQFLNYETWYGIHFGEDI